MRIIGGILKGRIFKAPQNLPVRPTTDMAKEALFNILNNQYDFDNITVLDLFSGTGSVGLEFASRGTSELTLIDKHPACISWLKKMLQEFDFKQAEVIKTDVFKWLQSPGNNTYDIIFADPPYDLPNLANIPKLIFENQYLKPSGILVLEHPSYLKFDQLDYFKEKRKYGNSTFSFFGL
ncbi:MAG: 16S rRNA (guanine(966)-N(2))-methyltransferase RsmD [Pedobacter sp.]|nr:MAG: 16S rRNA (guanine(966)-N(2))-methyltransferase RsmD [Pedobacter sp.]